jgi:molybdate transport system ATP-binding protein
MVAGLVTPDDGFIALDGEVLFDSGRKIDVPTAKRRIGMVFQQAHLFPHLSVRGNLLFGWRRLAPRERKIDPQALIAALNLEHLLENPVTTLSGGERQRVALGRAVLACPRLLLMDEPLTGLDDDLKYQVIPYLNRVVDEFGIPLLFISHALQEIRLLTDTVLEFNAGRLSGEISPESLARRQLGSDRDGYFNLLQVDGLQPAGELWAWRWGEQRLVMTEGWSREGTTVVALAAKDITLFKRHPEASSARNLIGCRVTDLFPMGNRIGVELTCGDCALVAQVVGDAAEELELTVNGNVVAAIKASAFRRLY